MRFITLDLSGVEIQESGWVSYRYSELMEAEVGEEAFAPDMPYLEEHASPLVSYTSHKTEDLSHSATGSS